MGILLDIILFIILILSIFLGYKKGLIALAFNLCAFFIALIITWILYTPITNLVISNTEFDENIKNTIIEKGVIQVEKNSNNEENQVSKYINDYVTVPATDKANDAIEQTAGIVAEKVVSIGVAILLFIAIRIILILLKFIAEFIANIPVIKQCNKAGGIIYGIIRGFFIIYVILAILFLVMSINNSGMVADIIHTSIISKYLYKNNIILDIIF